MDNNSLKQPFHIQSKTFLKQNKLSIITFAIPIIYLIVMLPHYILDYYVHDFTSYCGAAINGNLSYDGFSSMFMFLSGIATISPKFITLLCLVLLSLAIFHFINFFRSVFCKNSIQYLIILLVIISCGIWYYFYGKVFYDWPFTIYTYSVCLFSLQKIIINCRKNNFRLRDWYIFCALMGFMFSWKPYNIFLLAGLGLCMICYDETRNGIIISVLKKGIIAILISFIVVGIGYVIGNFNLLIDPIGTWQGIKAYPASSDFWQFMLSKQRIIWDQICDLPFNISVINLISLCLILFIAPILIRKWKYFMVSLFMTGCLCLYITFFSPGLVWHGFAFAGFVLTIVMFMFAEIDNKHRVGERIIFIAALIQCVVNFAIYIPMQNNWNKETNIAIAQIESNEEKIGQDVLEILDQVPKEETSIDLAVKRFKPMTINTSTWNIPSLDNTYFSLRNTIYLDPLMSNNYSFWSGFEEQYVRMSSESKYYIYIIPNAFYRIGDVADLNKYAWCNVVKTINRDNYTITLYERS